MQPRRVLVVDDEYGPRESIAYTLATSFSVETAERAAEALRKIKDQHYHVVVLDIRMPEMDGIKALEELRKIDPHVSVIILTGYGMLSTAQQAMVGGANQYMRKPPDVAELIDAVGVAHTCVLSSRVRVTDQTVKTRLPCPGRHVECVDHE